jgi:hypothetical protein
MLVECGCRSVVNHDIDGQIMLLTKKAEEKIKKTEGKLNKKSDSGQQETPIKETGTEVDESEEYDPFPKYVCSLTTMIFGTLIALFGDEHSNNKILFGGLTVVGAGAFIGIKAVYDWFHAKETNYLYCFF